MEGDARHAQSPIPLIRKVLIACRGELANHLLTEFAEAHVQTVAVYTGQDVTAVHIQLADEAICIGKTLKSYHNDWHRIISAAEISECDAIHPGDGPLSTHEEFVEACIKNNIRLLS
ncbi:MAG: acetyl-coenzyme carboxylase carboxyl transferase subunit alpha, biotin carboxylase [Verrucomicrobia bacterium]|jgi:acetyl-CoA carboxylase biotin carboxylase subunit|nr:acetyl-coenzyme carboxylase carboxyl transferase subunit alpha, biotin carboxylase [Verrucomicrobiota bacterium]